jgi:hypothetical protein
MTGIAGYVRMAVMLTISCVLSSSAEAATLLFEGFEDKVPPAGWVVSSLNGVNWKGNEKYWEWNWTGAEGFAAMVDSFSGHPQEYDASLVSPPVQLPADSQAELRIFSAFEPWSGDETAEVAVSDDGGASWTTVETLDSLASTVGPVSVDLSGYAGQTVQVLFRYSNPSPTAMDVYWQIDQVEITDSPTAPPVPGDLSGDGFVGQADLDIILGQWGHRGPAITDPRADPSGDGFVGQTDLDVVLGHWGDGAAE